MAKNLIVANWKMYPTLSDSLVLASSIKGHLDELSAVEVVLAPPMSWLITLKQEWRHWPRHLHLAAQNIWSEDQGAFTGEVSAYFLKDVVDYAIVGHSERRRYNSETNDLIREKVHACLRWRIKPILCVGETKRLFDSDNRLDSYRWSVVEKQLSEGLYGVKGEDIERVTIAYEPVWSIGGGRAAPKTYVELTVARIREYLKGKYGRAIADQVTILYGGSVEADNAADYLSLTDIGGLLVGSLSLKAKEFLRICRLASVKL